MAATPDIVLQSVIFADQAPNLQAAVTAAGKKGAVIIQPDYPGSDSYSNPNGILVLDLRPGRMRRDVAHGAAPMNAQQVPNYQGLGLTRAEPGPILPVGPRLTSPLGWFISTAILN